MRRLILLVLILSACAQTAPPQAIYTPAPTYTAVATSPALPTPTPHPLNDRWQRPHPIPTPRADGIAEVSYIEYRCYEQYFYGVADGQTLYLHLDMDSYLTCIQGATP